MTSTKHLVQRHQPGQKSARARLDEANMAAHLARLGKLTDPMRARIREQPTAMSPDAWARTFKIRQSEVEGYLTELTRAAEKGDA